MERNVELAEKVMRIILDDPTSHDQSLWVCKTMACFAGHAVLQHHSREEAIDMVLNVSDPYQLRTEAIKLLGLTDDEADIMFWGHNTIEDLEVMVKDISNGDPLTPGKDYPIALLPIHPPFTLQ